ncbi:hypothetical protein GCM10023321_83570 [Pseudonocardia eucalypti]|uniref:DUF1697 domain-containing protein n=1 Tax=Pseudonocardia eucalypti TaxID=648755 RepID=A0ABP9RER1_9PSEU
MSARTGPVAAWHTPPVARAVVFYRNMNLGHRNSPVRQVLERVLEEAGAESARSFQTNGTVLVEAADPRAVADRAAAGLQAACGYREVAFVRPFQQLVAILDREPFAGLTDERTYRETFTFLDDAPEFGAPLPWTNKRGDLEIISVADGVALSLVRDIGGRTGDPTSELEARLGVPATTRTLGTIQRLVKAYR